MKNRKIAVVGTVGVPANYGEFETLVENLVRYHDVHDLPYDVTVYCSSKSYEEQKSAYLSAHLKYIRFKPMVRKALCTIGFHCCLRCGAQM